MACSNRTRVLPRRLVAWVLAGGLALSACAAPAGTGTPSPTSSQSGGASTEQPTMGPSDYPELAMKIGTIIPLTGFQGAFGAWEQEAALLAEQVLNDGAQEAGLPIAFDVLIEDEQGNPDAATQAATKLVTADGASCLVGAQLSAVTLAIAQNVSIPRKVPTVSFLSTSPTLTALEDDGFVFRTHPSDTKQAIVLAELAAQGLNGASGKTLKVGARNDDYGANLARGVVARWEALGGTANMILWDPNAATYDNEAAQMVSGSPAGWVIIDFVTTYQKFAPSLVRTGEWDPTRTFVTALQVPNLPELVGAEASEGLRGLSPGTAADTEASRAFQDLWDENVGDRQVRGAGDVNVFDGIVLCGLAAVAARSTDGTQIRDTLTPVSGPPGDKYNLSDLAGAMEALAAGDDIDYVGAYGEIDWDENGDVTGGTYGVIEFQDGKLATIDVLLVE